MDQSSERSITLNVSEDSIEWHNIKNNKLYLVAAEKSSQLKKQLLIYDSTDENLIYQGVIEPTSDMVETGKNGLMIDYGSIN